MAIIDSIVDTAGAPNPFDNLPQWAKIIGYVGFPIAVASVLLWLFTGQIRSNSDTLSQHHKLTYQMYVQRLSTDAAMLRALSQICANGAQTRDDRQACATVIIPQPIIPQESNSDLRARLFN